MLALVLAAALAGVDTPIVTGADYLAACEGQEPRQKVACLAYFTGVVGTAQVFHEQSSLDSAEAARSFICPDDPRVDMEPASLSRIRSDPSYLRRSAALGVLAGLLDTYPCPAPAPMPEPDDGDLENQF
jgi:hypothetical protein